MGGRPQPLRRMSGRGSVVMTLQPGPLSPGMVAMLTPGRSVLRLCSGKFYFFTSRRNGQTIWLAPLDRSHGSSAWPIRECQYVGERGDDGVAGENAPSLLNQ